MAHEKSTENIKVSENLWRRIKNYSPEQKSKHQE